MEKGEYAVRKVHPEVDVDLAQLLQILNKTNDISGFAVTLRKRFMALK